MTVSLGGIILSDQLTLDIGPAAAAISQRRLIGGGQVIQTDATFGGRTLTLAGEHHWTLDQVEQIRSLQSLGQAVQLVHHRGTFLAVITDTANLLPSVDHHDPDPTDWYTGSITMIEV